MAQKIKAYAGSDPFVFVSYSHMDGKLVLPFIATLQEKCNVWFDEGIRFGSEWEDEIAEKLEKCSLFLFVITENSLQSANCKDEIAFAREQAKPFVNVLTSDGIELPKAFRLRYGRYQMCNLFAYETMEEAVEDMIDKCDDFGKAVKTATKPRPKIEETMEDEQSLPPVFSTRTITKPLPQRKAEEKPYQREGNYIFFGTYPQTQVTDNEIIEALNVQAGVLPTRENSQKWTSYKYYVNDVTAAQTTADILFDTGFVSDFMWYIDLFQNGEKYRGVYFTSYRPFATSVSSAAQYSHQDDNGYSLSTAYWFRYEPIKWRILRENDSDLLVLCEMIVDGQDYYHAALDNEKRSRTAVADYNRDYYAGKGSTVSGNVYDNNYQYSAIRKWLNETFYSTAFSDAQKARILPTIVDNSERSTNPEANDKLCGNGKNTYACENTEDSIFLLSEREVTTGAYGFDAEGGNYDVARRKKSTDYAKCQGVYTGTSGDHCGNGCWWLRSPRRDSSSNARYVENSGYVNNSNSVDFTYYGVVPALKIKRYKPLKELLEEQRKRRKMSGKRLFL